MTIVELMSMYTNVQNIINGLTVWSTTISNLEAGVSHITEYTRFCQIRICQNLLLLVMLFHLSQNKN